jgi:hypothetical protein
MLLQINGEMIRWGVLVKQRTVSYQLKKKSLLKLDLQKGKTSSQKFMSEHRAHAPYVSLFILVGTPSFLSFLIA